MKNNKKKETELDEMDEFLYKLAKEDIKPIPKEILDNIQKTIDSLDFDEPLPAKRKKHKVPLRYRFKEKLGTIITRPAPAIIASILIISLLATGAVGARQMSEKIFGKDTVRLTNIGISNEFTFTEEMEVALKQNVPLNLVQLNDDYYISIHSILLDEINFFTVFELHSKKTITDDLSFAINDLKISDENGSVLYDSYIEENINTNAGYNHIYNKENSIRELFFMFGNDNSNIQKLKFSFSDVEIYKLHTDLATTSNFQDIHINCDNISIDIPITKENYNTIQEYTWEKENVNSKYNIESAILTKTGLYITLQTPIAEIEPLVRTNNKFYPMLYSLPLKRVGSNGFLIVLSYNITEYQDNIQLYNNLDKNIYNLIPSN